MIELYHFWDSFCSFKVRLCLEEKGIAWTGRHIDLMAFENLTPEYLAINRHGVVPTIIHDGRVINESSIINEYLEDAFPDVPLRPADAFERAQMRLWVKHEEDVLFRAIRPASLNLMMKQALGRFTEEELDARLQHHPRPDKISQLKQMFKAPFDERAVGQSRKMLRSALTAMEKRLAQGSWLAGDSYSLADIAAAPVIDRIQCLGLADLWSDMPSVTNWIERLTSRPAYAIAKPRDEFRMPKPLAA